MTRRYDLIVIGAGIAGVSASNKCASKGWKVAIVDAPPLAGGPAIIAPACRTVVTLVEPESLSFV